MKNESAEFLPDVLSDAIKFGSLMETFIKTSVITGDTGSRGSVGSQKSLSVRLSSVSNANDVVLHI